MTDDREQEQEQEAQTPAGVAQSFAALLRTVASSVLDVSPGEAEKLRETLLQERAAIDAQIALLDKALEGRNGTSFRESAMPTRAQGAATLFPTYSGPPRGLPKKPTRRGVLLKAMAREQGEWPTAKMRAVLEDAKMLGEGDTNKRFWSLVSQLKKRGEIEHTRPSTYKITPKGLEIALA